MIILYYVIYNSELLIYGFLYFLVFMFLYFFLLARYVRRICYKVSSRVFIVNQTYYVFHQ